MRDSNLVWRDGSTDLTATDTNDAALDLGKGGVQHELHIVIEVPAADGTTPTLDIEFVASDDNGSTPKEKWDIPQITAAGVYEARINTRRRYLEADYTVGGTTPDFGAVKVHGATGVGYRSANISNA